MGDDWKNQRSTDVILHINVWKVNGMFLFSLFHLLCSVVDHGLNNLAIVNLVKSAGIKIIFSQEG